MNGNGQYLQEQQIIQFSKSKMAAVCYGPNFLLKYLNEVFRRPTAVSQNKYHNTSLYLCHLLSSGSRPSSPK